MTTVMDPEERTVVTEPPDSKDSKSVAIAAVFIASIALLVAMVAIGVATRNHRSGRTVVAAAPTTAGASGAPTASVATKAPTLAVTVKDFAVTTAQPSVAAGLVDLAVTNAGPLPHELLVFKTDLAPDQLPVGLDGRVNEAGDGIQKAFDSGDNVNPGSTKTFSAAFTAGKYVLVCNLPGHFHAGMRTAFTVTPASIAPVAVAVTIKDFAVTTAQPSVAAGLVDLAVTNAGPLPHELLVFKTDLAPDQLPVGADGRVSETGDGVQKAFDSGDNVNPGATKSFSAAFTAGKYVLVCNLPGHYHAGMRASFTVN